MSNFGSFNTYVGADETATPETPQATATMTGGVTSGTFSGTEANIENLRYASVSAADLSPYPDFDWRSTARSSRGLPTNQIKADSVVEVSGMTSKVSVLVKAGLLVETPEGYVLPSEVKTSSAGMQPSGEDSTETNQSVDTDTASMSVETVQAVEAAIEPFNQAVLDVGLAQSISVATGDMDISEMVQGVAQRSGMDPVEVSQRINLAVQAYQAQTDNYLGKMGLAAEEIPEFYAFCKQSQNKAELKSAIQNQTYGRDMSAWKPLVSRYLNNVAPDVRVLESRGFSVKGDQVRINGVWMNVKAAARAGII